MQLQVAAVRYLCMKGFDTPQTRLTGPGWNGGGDWPFDVWLRRGLADTHNDVLSEDLPREWLALIEAAAKSPAKR